MRTNLAALSTLFMWRGRLFTSLSYIRCEWVLTSQYLPCPCSYSFKTVCMKEQAGDQFAPTQKKTKTKKQKPAKLPNIYLELHCHIFFRASLWLIYVVMLFLLKMTSRDRLKMYKRPWVCLKPLRSTESAHALLFRDFSWNTDPSSAFAFCFLIVIVCFFVYTRQSGFVRVVLSSKSHIS